MREDVEFTIKNNTFRLSDYHLKVETYQIGIPEPKTEYLEIPFSNVVYDFTEYFGSVSYEQRPITISCQLMKSTPCWQKIMDQVQNIMHGQLATFRFVSDSEWYYTGRITVDTNEHENWNYATVSFSITCLPMKTNNEGVSKL